MINGVAFSPRLRIILAKARLEASHLYHEYVGTEHLVLALLRDGDGAAGDVVRQLQMTPEQIRQKIEETVPASRAAPVGPDLPYTSRTKRVLELTVEEALRAQASVAETEHLLLALCVEEHGIGARVLEWAGLTTDVARAELQRRSEMKPDSPPPLEHG